MRSGWLPGLDTAAAELAATGLMRMAVGEWMPSTAVRPTGLWWVRATLFADTWLAFRGTSAQGGLRMPIGAVIRSLAYRAAKLFLQTYQGDATTALARVGHQSALASERARRTGLSHPSEPAAWTLVWHGLQAIAASGPHATATGLPPSLGPHDRQLAERCEAYIRGRHYRQDALALMLSCARIAALAIVQLSDGQSALAHAYLDEHVSRVMPCVEPAPPWVPDHAGHITNG